MFVTRIAKTSPEAIMGSWLLFCVPIMILLSYAEKQYGFDERVFNIAATASLIGIVVSIITKGVCSIIYYGRVEKTVEAELNSVRLRTQELVQDIKALNPNATLDELEAMLSQAEMIIHKAKLSLK